MSLSLSFLLKIFSLRAEKLEEEGVLLEMVLAVLCISRKKFLQTKLRVKGKKQKERKQRKRIGGLWRELLDKKNIREKAVG